MWLSLDQQFIKDISETVDFIKTRFPPVKSYFFFSIKNYFYKFLNFIYYYYFF